MWCVWSFPLERLIGTLLAMERSHSSPQASLMNAINKRHLFERILMFSEAHCLVERKAVTSTSARMANPGGGEENGSHAGEDGTVVTGGGATHGGYSYSSR